MKKLNIITILVVMLCLVFSSFTVLAEPDDSTQPQTQEQTESVTEPSTEAPVTEEPSTDDNFISSDYDTTEPDSSEDTTKETTTKNQTPSTTGKTTSAGNETTTRRANSTQAQTTTRRPTVAQNNEDDDDEDVQVNNSVSLPEEEDDLPEGSFYVYLERNNGEKRLKAVLTKPELVTEPSVPYREGFIFEGWYADPMFTTEWDFSKDLAKEGTVIYAKWTPDPNAVVYKISVATVEGGSIQVNPMEASVGEPVLITVKPDENMRLVAGSITVNGKATDLLSFDMPAEDVVVSARFELIPEVQEPVEKKSPLPFILGGVGFLLIVGIIVLVVLKRRNSFTDDEIDENGTIIDEDDDMSWVDESIVVEDGFKDGEKVIGNFVPEDDFSFEAEDTDE